MKREWTDKDEGAVSAAEKQQLQRKLRLPDESRKASADLHHPLAADLFSHCCQALDALVSFIESSVEQGSASLCILPDLACSIV